MLDRPDKILVMVDGSLGSLVACSSAREAFLAWANAPAREGHDSPASAPKPAGPMALLCAPDGPSREAKLAAAASIARACLLDPVALPGAIETPEMKEGERQSHLLIRALHHAASLGRDTLVWPASFGTSAGSGVDLDALSRAVDRALLVARLVGIDAADHGRSMVRIETPFADFDDRQVAELAADLGVPVRLCWWQSASGAEAERERHRWVSALLSVGWSGDGVAGGSSGPSVAGGGMLSHGFTVE